MEKGLKSDSAAYLKSWLESLHEDPKFLKSILPDVKRSVSMAINRIDRIQMDIDNGIESDKKIYDQETKSLESAFAHRGNTKDKTIELPQSKSSEEKQDVDQTEAVAKEVVHHGRGR